jgi:hypothetical protein
MCSAHGSIENRLKANSGNFSVNGRNENSGWYSLGTWFQMKIENKLFELIGLLLLKLNRKA